jgi:hypothetical protein
MNRNPNPARTGGAIACVAAALSTLIAIGILAGVTTLFQSRGMPMAQLAAAERACAGKVYVSDQEACMREWVAASQGEAHGQSLDGARGAASIAPNSTLVGEVM